MVKKMTKSAAKKRLLEIEAKALNLMSDDYMSVDDYAGIKKITMKRMRQLK